MTKHYIPENKKIYSLTNASKLLFDLARSKSDLTAFVAEISVADYNMLRDSPDCMPFAITDSLYDGNTVIYRDLTKARERFMMICLVDEKQLEDRI